MTPDLDRRFMAEAIALGRGQRGQTWPNPAVGAVVVRQSDGQPIVVGRGATATGGRPHAEAVALAQAGELAQGATVYVSLEPCAWRSNAGANRPCVDILIASGVTRVVVATLDPHPEIAGRGVALLRTAGLDVETGLLAAEADDANKGHILRITKGRPFVTLKLALSSDGMIGRRDSGQIAITGSEARADVHAMRADHDAILVGSGTAIADDPQLTCRSPGLEDRSPVRVILDRRARLPLQSKLVESTDAVPVWLMCDHHAPAAHLSALRARGVRILKCEPTELDLGMALNMLAQAGITRLLIEGGAAIAKALMRESLADEVVLYYAPTIVGPDGIRMFDEITDPFCDHPDYEMLDETRLGDDRKRVHKKRDR